VHDELAARTLYAVRGESGGLRIVSENWQPL
jgi:hypothetical protein